MTIALTQRLALEKHPDEIETYSIDYARRLASGESLTGSPEVVVLREATGVDDDVSAEFSITSVQLSGTAVVFTLGEADDGEQAAGSYVVRVKASTTGGRAPVSLHRLTVLDLGRTSDPSA